MIFIQQYVLCNDFRAVSTCIRICLAMSVYFLTGFGCQFHFYLVKLLPCPITLVCSVQLGINKFQTGQKRRR